jgi:hypothetical protein
VNVCRSESAGLVGMEIDESKKRLKTLERVKGIEPSYSAWKAAALPLSYTRARRSTITAGKRPQPPSADLARPDGRPLGDRCSLAVLRARRGP